MTLSITLFIISLICYVISQIQLFGHLKWSKDQFDFWGMQAGDRKYEQDPGHGFTIAPDNIYYRWLGIKWKERFPGSSTIFVPFVTGYHLQQFFSFKLLFISVSLQLQEFWYSFFFMWGIEVIVFNIGFKVLSKK